MGYLCIMNTILFPLLALIAGVFLGAQGGLNAQLGVHLKQPLWASVIAFTCSAFFALLFVVIGRKGLPGPGLWSEIPYYLWFSGGFMSVVGISLYYYTIPKLGLSVMISYGLCGQLLFALIVGHYGWLNLPVNPITVTRAVGAGTMIIGVLLMNVV